MASNLDFKIENPPRTNIHHWVMRQARRIQILGYQHDYATKVLTAAVQECAGLGLLRRPVTPYDITSALATAYSTEIDKQVAPPCVYDPISGWPSYIQPPRDEFDPDIFARAVAESPVKGVADIPPSKGYWTDLFQPGSLLCVGDSPQSFRVVKAEFLKDYGDAQFIVPNPLRAMTGTTKNGNRSAHCRDAMGSRHFIIIENDQGYTADEQVAAAFWLAKETEVTIRLMVSSGKKSIHTWIDTRGIPDETVNAWFRLAVLVGADPRLIVPEQLCRLPGGLRPDTNTRQTILYCNV